MEPKWSQLDLKDSSLDINALSRPFDMGMLYNARNDQLIPGISPWKSEDIVKKTLITRHINTGFQVAMSDRLSEKTKLLDVSASVKASFLSGLVEVEGSAKFLNNKTSSTHQCSLTLKYHKTTEFKELKLLELEVPNREVLKTNATHVVCGITYGANALMEFQQTASDASEKQDINGNLHVMINKLPLIEINADGSLKMTDEEKEKVKNFSCKFYGDLNLKELPFTYEEAVRVYKTLPNLLGAKGEKAVPMKVWLYPLCKLYDTESKLKRMISESLVSQVEKVMDDFHQADIRTNDLLERSSEIKTGDIVLKLEQFQSSLRVFTAEFLQKLAKLMPAIREGILEETALRDVLKTQQASGFSGQEMNQWLDGKETEISVVTMNIKQIPDYKIKSPGPDFDSFLMDPDNSDAFVFSFTSLSYEEPYLKKILQSGDDFKSGSTCSTPEQYPTEEVPWYRRPEVKEALNSALSVFKNAPKNKVISFISDPKYPGASVQWYHNAALKDPHITNFPVQHCEDCESFYIDECGVHGPPNFTPDVPVPVGVPDRARLTLPPGLVIRKSNIPNAGLGVFSKDQTVPRGTHFGPYEGEVEDRLSWMLCKSGKADGDMEDKSETHFNWMRYVKHARNDEEQNLVAFQYRGGIVYRCCKPIAPGEELLVWYGEDYGRNMVFIFDTLRDIKYSTKGVGSETEKAQIADSHDSHLSMGPAQEAGDLDPLDATLEISALSRPLNVGMLYNARNDQLIPGISLWKNEDIVKKTLVSPLPNTGFQVAMSDRLSEKTRLMDVSASLKASFWGGLVEVDGSAKYLNNKTSSTHQCSATLKYHVTTEFRELRMSELETPKPDIFDKTDATHVVCAVMYGADAFMEFQETASDASNKQEIEGNLHVMINKLPTIGINADGSLKMNDEDKNKVKNFTCTFCGDFNVEELPSTYEEAVKVYKELPKLLGAKEEHVVPLKIWLYPLDKLYNTESKLKRMISGSMVSQVEKVMDDFHQADIRTNDLLQRSKEIKAGDIVLKLEQFQSSLRDFTAEFMQSLTKLIPDIREGILPETTLRDLLKTQHASGFLGEKMEQWLDGKETEINIVTMNIKKMPGCKIKTPGPELDTFIMDPNVINAFVFNFTSLSYEEPYLKKIWYQIPWYKRSDVWEALHSSLSTFIGAPVKNKVISFISDPKYPGASIHWYHNAALKDPHVTHIAKQLYACDLTLDPSTAFMLLKVSEGKKTVTLVDKVEPYRGGKRFQYVLQVLSEESEPLPDRCYWECEWTLAAPEIAVAYQSISRDSKPTGNDSIFGMNAKSWCMRFQSGGWGFWHNKECTTISVHSCSRVGVYLDRKAGILSFFNVSSGTLVHLYTFNTTFSDESLYAGFGLGGIMWNTPNRTATLCKVT